MSWCDKLASTPAIGLRFEPRIVPAELVLRTWAPMLRRFVKDDTPTFTVDTQDSFGVELTTEEGFKYGSDMLRTHVTFQHRLRAKPVSGGPPTMELLSTPAPYTELLDEVSARLVEATLLMPESGTQMITRIGVVSSTQVALDEVPPGIVSFIEYLARPWRAGLDNLQVQLSAKLGEKPGWKDRCIHTVIKPEDEESLFTLQFDWQREFSPSRATHADTLADLIDQAKKSALSYYEQIAIGSLFDEELISERD